MATTIADTIHELQTHAKGVIDRALAEERDLTERELAEVKSAQGELDRLEKKQASRHRAGNLLAELNTLSARAGGTSPEFRGSSAGESLGQLIAQHPAIGQLRQHGSDVPVMFVVESKAISGGAICGPLLTPPPPPLPMPVPGLSVPRPLRVSELLMHMPASESPCSYLQLLARTADAAVVAPGAPKPDIGVNGTLLSAVFEKVAGWTAVNDELLEDGPGLARVLDAELRRALADAIDLEVINSVGSATSFVGLRPGATGPDTAATGLSPVAALAKAAGALFDASGLFPDAIVVNGKTAAASASVLASTAGVFLTGPPSLVGTATPSWAGGLRVAISPAMPDGIGLIGNFSEGAHLASKRGVSVKADSSGTNFTSNITIVRAEVRISLMITNPLSFGEVSALPSGA